MALLSNWIEKQKHQMGIFLSQLFDKKIVISYNKWTNYYLQPRIVIRKGNYATLLVE
jgi:hypothetical protein